MVLNNKGQTVFYTLMLGLLIVVIALALTPVVKVFVDDARNSTSDTQVGLDCSNESISDFTKSQCIITDVSIPYFFFGLIGIALLVIGAQVVIG